MSNRKFAIFVSAIAVLGLVTGYRLSALPHLQTYKLLNIVGLCYDLLAVIVLSEIAASSPKWKAFAVAKIAPAVLWLNLIFPIGVFVSAFIATILHRPSATTVSTFALAFSAYAMPPVIILGELVVDPRFAILKGLQSRWRWFGLLLLLTGVGLQLMAAILGL